jgi:N-terminal domain of oxidoreductase
MLLRTIYLSLDSYMRGRMNAGASYARPVEVGEVMEGRSVCEVVKSNIADYKAGDIVLAGTGWQEYSLSEGKGVQKVDPTLGPISYALGVLGMPGLTAYAGLLNIGKPQRGETLVLAAASAHVAPGGPFADQRREAPRGGLLGERGAACGRRVTIRSARAPLPALRWALAAQPAVWRRLGALAPDPST